jgi:hypothetical protein
LLVAGPSRFRCSSVALHPHFPERSAQTLDVRLTDPLQSKLLDEPGDVLKAGAHIGRQQLKLGVDGRIQGFYTPSHVVLTLCASTMRRHEGRHGRLRVRATIALMNVVTQSC